MNAVNIYEAKAHLSVLVRKVQRKGKTITICRNGEPVADLMPHRKAADPTKQDVPLKGAVFHGDPCAPVGEEDWIVPLFHLTVLLSQRPV